MDGHSCGEFLGRGRAPAASAPCSPPFPRLRLPAVNTGLCGVGDVSQRRGVLEVTGASSLQARPGPGLNWLPQQPLFPGLIGEGEGEPETGDSLFWAQTEGARGCLVTMVSQWGVGDGGGDR